MKVIGANFAKKVEVNTRGKNIALKNYVIGRKEGK